MNHTSLKIFMVVAEELSIIKAAKRLGRVQSNITTRIQQLEQELDVQLFLRDNKSCNFPPQERHFSVTADSCLPWQMKPDKLCIRSNRQEFYALAAWNRQWPAVLISHYQTLATPFLMCICNW